MDERLRAGRVIEEIEPAHNIGVHRDDNGREYLSFDVIARLDNSEKVNIHVPKTYLDLECIDVEYKKTDQYLFKNGSRLHEDIFCFNDIKKSLKLTCKSGDILFYIEPIKQMTKSEIEEKLGYKIEIVGESNHE